MHLSTGSLVIKIISYIGRFHTLKPYLAYSWKQGTNIITEKKINLLNLAHMVKTEQITLIYRVSAILWFVFFSCYSFFLWDYFYLHITYFFYTSSRLHESDQSIFRKISSFEFRSLKLGKKLVWCVKLISVIGFELVLTL